MDVIVITNYFILQNPSCQRQRRSKFASHLGLLSISAASPSVLNQLQLAIFTSIPLNQPHLHVQNQKHLLYLKLDFQCVFKKCKVLYFYRYTKHIFRSTIIQTRAYHV